MDNKFKIFVILAIAVLGVSIAASTFIVLKQVGGQKQETVAKGTKPKLTEASMGDAIMTNIAVGEDGIQHFAKVKLSLGVDSSDEKAYAAFSEILTSHAAGIRNEIIAVIGEQTYTMLSGAGGKTKLADEIVARLNKLLETEMISEVYYEDYFVQ